MPTSPISKKSAVKKSLPIKWRDCAWSARVTIRSLDHRRLGQISWESDARISDWNLGQRKLRFQSTPRWGRAGGRSPLFDSILPSSGGPARLFPTSRLGNLL